MDVLGAGNGRARVGPGLWVFVLLCALAGGCGSRGHDNPLDPENPSTQGQVPGFRAVAGDGRVTLSWADLGLRDLGGVDLLKEGPGADPETLSVPVASTREWIDLEVENGATYRYRASYLVTGDATAHLSAVDAATPGPERVWVVDEGWSGLRRIAPDARDVSFSVAYGGYFRSLSVDRVRDRVWAANPTLDQVVAVDGTGTVVGVIAVSSPLKVAADESDGSVWVVGSWGVARFDTSGARTFEDPAPSNPKDIVVDALREIVWVADGGTGEGGSLWMREADGTTVHVFGFDYPFALSVDGEGKVWVVDAYSGRVYRVDPDAPGTALSVGDFAQPVDVAASPDGGAWVADWDAGAVVRLGPDLERLETVRGFDRPRAVAVSVCDTTLWVTEAYGGRVVKVGRDGERLGQVGGLDFPKDIALGVGSPCPGRGRSGLDKPRPL